MEQCIAHLAHLAYLGPGGPEFLLVILILLVMFGAKDAPRILRKLNEIINQVRNTADGFKREVMYGDLNADHEPYEAADVEEDCSYYDEEVYQPEDGGYPDEDEPVTDSAPVEGEDSAEAADTSAQKTEAENAADGEDDDRKV